MMKLNKSKKIKSMIKIKITTVKLIVKKMKINKMKKLKRSKRKCHLHSRRKMQHKKATKMIKTPHPMMKNQM